MFSIFKKTKKEDYYESLGYIEPEILEEMEQEYEDIKLPKEETRCGRYIFYAPCDLTLSPQEEITIPIGVDIELDNELFVLIYQNRVVDILDKNHNGQLLVKIFNDNNNDLQIEKGKPLIKGYVLL